MMSKRDAIGAVLAGGRSRRMGAAKAVVDLGGRPLVAWPIRSRTMGTGGSRFAMKVPLIAWLSAEPITGP